MYNRKNRNLVSFVKYAFFLTCGYLLPSFQGKFSETYDIDLSKNKMSFVKSLSGQSGLTINGPLYHADGVPVGGVYHGKNQTWDPGFVMPDDNIMHNGERGLNNFNLYGYGGVFILYNDSCVIKSNADFYNQDYKNKMKGVTRAFQNGPILINDGIIPNAIIRLGGQKTIRVGIGYEKPGSKIRVIISEKPETLSEFAHRAKRMGVQNLMYLDGRVVGIGLDGRCQGYIPENAWKLNFR